MAITGYQVISAQSPEALETAVNTAITGGYFPLGAPFRPALSPNTLQAMTLGTSDSGSSTPYTLPAATTSTLGGVIVGDNLTVDSTGKLSGAAAYTLSAATSSALGGVKMAAYVANTGTSTATTVTDAVTDLNTLATNVNAILAALQAAGVMATSS